MIDPGDVQAEIEHETVICGGCGRVFAVFDSGVDDVILFDPITGQSSPDYLICDCGTHVWLEPEPTGGRRPWQLMTIGGRPRLTGPVIPARPGLLIRLLIRLLEWAERRAHE
jgi:hypothetical protein